jgi:hypothetical protein
MRQGRCGEWPELLAVFSVPLKIADVCLVSGPALQHKSLRLANPHVFPKIVGAGCSSDRKLNQHACLEFASRAEAETLEADSAVPLRSCQLCQTDT